MVQNIKVINKKHFTIKNFLLFFLLVSNALIANARNATDTSIYNYLKTDGHFTVYTRLIEDLNYTELLSSTTKSTLFVVTDSAFNEFWKNNRWGVTRYDQLSLAQKKYLFNPLIINAAHSISDFAKWDNSTIFPMCYLNSMQITDSIPYLKGEQLPTSKYWDSRRSSGVHLLCDNTVMPTPFFSQRFLNMSSITDNDLKFILGINSRSYNDFHIFNDKVIKADIECTNGYIHMLQSVLIPPVNMAQYIQSNPRTSIFSRLLDRFCAPYYDYINTNLYSEAHPEFTDSIFTKKYFSKSGGVWSYPDGMQINTNLMLPFDPGKNDYTAFSVYIHMAAMFVPTDEAMMNYFNSPLGAILKNNYGSWDNVPDELVALIIGRCMRPSLIESVPSKFNIMVDTRVQKLPVEENDIVEAYTGSNGEVYVTNKMYPPIDFITTFSPLIINGNAKIMNWAIDYNSFNRLYLSSLTTNCNLFVPTDEYFRDYIDPFAYAKDMAGALKFWYNTQTSLVNATVYKFDKQTSVIGDSIGVITSRDFIASRLMDLLKSHIVMDDIQSGKSYYTTKGNTPLKVSGTGNSMTVQGGGNIAKGTHSNVLNVYNQANGKTYFIDKPLQPSLKSVYKVLSETPEFSSFFALLNGFPATNSSVIFVSKPSNYGIDFNIRFFNTFNYTVYVPTNAAIDQAIQSGIIKPWTTQGAIVGINDMTDATAKAAAILKLERFIRYHFQDNSVFVDNQPFSGVYRTATIKNDNAATGLGTAINKFYKIAVSANEAGITLTSETGNTAHVVTSNGLYNITTRDYIFNYNPASVKNIDETGTGMYNFYSSAISTASSAVIHQIDNVLTFE